MAVAAAPTPPMPWRTPMQSPPTSEGAALIEGLLRPGPSSAERARTRS